MVSRGHHPKLLLNTLMQCQCQLRHQEVDLIFLAHFSGLIFDLINFIFLLMNVVPILLLLNQCVNLIQSLLHFAVLLLQETLFILL